jgi:hypothetical protein
MKYQKNSSGQYVIKGHTYDLLVGSRAQVIHGTAYKTTGELTKSHLLQNKHGRIVSRSKYNTGKNKNKNNLLLNGYTAKKGKFGYVKIGTRSRRGRRKTRGGTTDPTNSGEPTIPDGLDQGAQRGMPDSSPANIPVGGVEGVNNSSLANTAAPFVGGRRKRTRGGILLGGKKRKTQKRGGGALRPLTPADF